MEIKGKLVCAMFLVLALLGCLSMVAKADGAQPCKFIKVREMENGDAECAKCCEKEGLMQGTTYNACRCITKFT